jgi:deoxyribodipyrimidine photo-lyase
MGLPPDFCVRMSKVRTSVFWFRRDLRLADNAGLYHALRSGVSVQPIFIFDRHILDALPNRQDMRVQFIHDALASLQQQLAAVGATLHVLYDTPANAFARLADMYDIEAVYTNEDYEPYARNRDAQIAEWLKNKGIAFHTFKDQVIFNPNEVLKDNGTPYTVYTPYSRKWKEHLNDFYLKAYPTEKYYNQFRQSAALPLPSLADIGFLPAPFKAPPLMPEEALVRHYNETRDYPAVDGTTRLGVHLRFGTVSVRQVATMARELNPVFLSELIWREFFMSILWHYPHVEKGSFKKEYDGIVWRNNEQEFEAWCKGQTGYAIVDAGMRELNTTGYMHNRVRMIVASFLTKDLLIDWRWGEAYFAEKLMDFDLSANNGNWQWAAGCGCDAAPYFRVFNPLLQTQKFDPQLKYVRHWVPEYDKLTYVRPIVQHDAARDRCLKVYKAALEAAR